MPERPHSAAQHNSIFEQVIYQPQLLRSNRQLLKTSLHTKEEVEE